MLTKRALIVLLAGLNLFLLAAVLFQFVGLPKAFADASGGGGVACVTAKAAGQSFDIVYVLDGNNLHAFYPTNFQTKKHGLASTRDLSVDFPNK